MRQNLGDLSPVNTAADGCQKPPPIRLLAYSNPLASLHLVSRGVVIRYGCHSVFGTITCHSERSLNLRDLGPDTNGSSAMRNRRGRPEAFVIPMRGVGRMRPGLYPSSPSHRLPPASVKSQPLSRTRVIPKASDSRPGPLVNFGRSFGPCKVTLRDLAISWMPDRGSSARNSTLPARPSGSQETFRQ